MAHNTTASLALPVQTYYDNVLLSTPVPNLIHSMGATKKSLKRNSGDTVRMERFNLLDTALVPLGNSGINPPGQLLSSTYIDAKIEFYGTYVSINEQLPILSESPILNQAAIRLGESMRRTEDTLMREMLRTTASVHVCTGGVNGDSITEITLTDIQDVVSTLLQADATTMAGSTDASDKFGTAPVSSAFYGLGHSALSKSLSNLKGFTRTYQYGTQTGIKQTEWGAVDSVRFFLSSIGSKDTGASGLGADVYNTFICGMDAYANVKLDNYKAQTIFRDGKIAGGPLALNQTMGYKMAEAPVITNDAWVIKLRSTL